jgi:DNA replication and repair protein RecF
VLEAVYYLATFTSFHAQSDRQLINFLSSQNSLAVTRIVGDFQRGESKHRIEVRLILENGVNGGTRLRKEILMDGVKRNVYDALGQFNAVIFLPQMMSIIEDGPEERRRYLNMTLSQAMPGYSRALSEYTQALAQRNALLKQLSERAGDPDQLLYWDQTLTRSGAVLVLARIQAIQELERHAARIHQRLTDGQEVLRLVYLPSYDPLPAPEGQFSLPMQTTVQRTGFSIDQIQQGFAQRLQKLRNEEIARGVTTIGPHRDELVFLANGVDLGDFGSRGQVRTALLALKLAEVSWLKDRTGHWPVLLLDEILAELDESRRRDLLDALQECEQGILTTTDLHLYEPAFAQSSTIWRVENGVVRTGD